MKLGINQAYFMPYLGYFQLIHSVDKFIVYELLSYRVQGWMHRNRLLGKATDTPFTINIPVKAKSSNVLIRDVRLADELAYRIEKILKSLSLNYAKAEHFSKIFPWLEAQFEQIEASDLHTFNASLIMATCDFIGITTEVQFQNSHYQDMEDRLVLSCAEPASEKNKLLTLPRKVRRVIEMCRREHATTFINLPGGQELYDAKVFSRFGIDLKFTAVPDVEYPQFTDEFVPNLSIIDVLMHCGPRNTLKLVEQRKLI